MITRFCSGLAQYIYSQGACPESKIPWIQYKLELWFGRLVTYPCLVLIAGLSGCFNPGTFFPAVFLLVLWVILRAFIGGYHAESRVSCFIASLGIYAASVFLVAPLLSQHKLACFCALVVCGIGVFIWAPYIHPNCYCKEGNEIKVKRACRIVFCIQSAMLTALFFAGVPIQFIGFGITGMLACVSLMIYAILSEIVGGKIHEKVQ